MGHTSQRDRMEPCGANIRTQVHRVSNVFSGGQEPVKVIPKYHSDAVRLSFLDDQARSGVQCD